MRAAFSAVLSEAGIAPYVSNFVAFSMTSRYVLMLKVLRRATRLLFYRYMIGVDVCKLSAA